MGLGRSQLVHRRFAHDKKYDLCSHPLKALLFLPKFDTMSFDQKLIGQTSFSQLVMVTSVG
jgi:hypothetical protein